MPVIVILNVVLSVVVLAAVLGLLLNSIVMEHRDLSLRAALRTSPEATRVMAGKTPRRAAAHRLPAAAAAGPLA